jgi:hypothetical protein
MATLRFVLPLSILALVGASVTGCKEEPPPPQPEPAASASASISPNKGRASSLRTPTSPVPKVDPLTMKEYRVELCHIGALTLRQAGDAYLASLGGGEPSAKKLPNFGKGAPPPTARTPLLKTDIMAGRVPPGASAAPAAGATPPAQPGKTATAPDTSAAARPPFELALRAPHERNARACTAASAMKDPAMDGVDGALAELGPFAVELAKNIVTTNAYYQKEEYKADKLAKGKELHKKLVEDFEKFDELYKKLDDAVIAYRAAHPAAATPDKGQALTATTLADAAAILNATRAAKVEPEAVKAAIAKLDTDIAALKDFGKLEATDPWSKIMAPALDAYSRAATAALATVGPKGIDNEQFLTLITGMTSLIESRHRAYTRALVARERKDAAAADGSAAPVAAPPGAAAAPAKPNAQTEEPAH